MDDESILLRVDAGVAHVEFNRPEALNAWTPEMGRLLLRTLRQVSADPTVRAVLLTGAGRAFCAGTDAKGARDVLPNGDPDVSNRLRDIYNPIILTVRSAPKPVIAAVQGACAGMGASVALSCDLVLAAENAYFLMAFVRLGLMPDGGVNTLLVERLGLARATALTMLAERLPAATALDWGLVNSVHPGDELGAAAWDLTRRLAEGPTLALANIKRTLHEIALPKLADQLEREATRQQEHGATADYAEGRAAFAEKRPARFQGQ